MDRDAIELSRDLDILQETRPYNMHEKEYPIADLRERKKGRNRNLRCPCGSGKKYKKCCGSA